MKNRHKGSLNAFILIAALFALSFFSFSGVSDAQQIGADNTQPASNMLQFKSGNHILGFAPDKAYLVSMDHALTVQFLGTKGVLPKADTDASAKGAMTKASCLGKVVYQNLWDGIMLTYAAAKDGITESTYHVAPGADVSKIRLKYNVPVEIQKSGSLKFKFQKGYITETAPVAWQDIDGKSVPVNLSFKVSNGEVGFKVDKYDEKYPLIIDPTYSWHTFYGDVSNVYTYENIGYAIAVDGSGNIYVTGDSEADWAIGSGLHAHSAAKDVFVLKLNSSGAYQWHTFYGGAYNVFGQAIAVGSDGNIYATGFSYGTWPETPVNPFSGSNGNNTNIFILKLNSSGARQWHTFLGNNTKDHGGQGIAVDGSGNVYVSGWSDASWGSNTLHGFTSGSNNIFVLQLDSGGNLVWHTFYGSGYGDSGNAIALDDNSNVYVSGNSSQTWTGPSGEVPLHPSSSISPNSNILVIKLTSSGGYKWHTFYGANTYINNGQGIAVDGNDSVYITGLSGATWNGPDTATCISGSAPCQPLNPFSASGKDIFVLKLDSSGTYKWHTFYGAGAGNGDDGNSIAVDDSGNVYITGTSSATWNGPATGTCISGSAPCQPLNPFSGAYYDSFVLKLNSVGTYQWHTFYAPTGANTYCSWSQHALALGNGIAADGIGNVYFTGYSTAGWGAPNNPYTGCSFDVLVLKLLSDTCPTGPAEIQETATTYDSIRKAYNNVSATEDQSILIQSLDLIENLNLTRNVNTKLSGGYSCDFSYSAGSMSVVHGTITIGGSGAVTLENIILQ